MARNKQDNAQLAATEAWSVVVVCEDAALHTHALSVCDQFVRSYWAEVELQFSWWLSDGLHDPEKASVAAAAAANADLIIFAVHPDGDLPESLTAWVESWLAQRGEREGALIGLLREPASIPGGTSPKHIYLRKIAHRAKMDFLSEMPRTVPGAIPSNSETIARRAGQVTSVLDEILQQPRPPSHYGLNE